ncbi:MAG TPA: AI-2E family transporter [Candidatus Saccharimonadales bacterium]|nr:AI-2E family transporter [Candidatus Saccharimonadales bacterium]
MERTKGALKDDDTTNSGKLEDLVPALETSTKIATLTDAERLRHARVQSASLAVLAVGGVLTLMYMAKAVLILTLVSVLIAFMLAPIVELCQRIHLPRSFGSMIAVLVMCAAMYGIFYVSYSQADEFIAELPKYSGRIRAVLNQVRLRAERVRQTTRNVMPEEKSEKGTVTIRQTSTWVDDLTSGAVGATETVLLVAFVPFLVFFMLSWQDHVRSSTVMLFNMENRNTAYVTLGLISQMIRAFIVGNVVIGIILGITSTIAFWILGVPYFYVIGMISGIVSLLPYLGIVLAILPPVVVSLNSLTVKSFLSVVAVVAISHVIALNVLYPKIIGRRLQLNPLAVTLALLFWGWLWGAMGLILAVPLTAAIKIIFDHVDSLRSWGAWLGE